MKVVAFDMYRTLLDIELDENKPEAYAFLSAKRWRPRQVKAQAKALSKACQMDQVSLASVMVCLLCRGQLGLLPPGRF